MRLFATNTNHSPLLAPSVALDATYAYWIDSPNPLGAVMRGAKDGSSATTLVGGVVSPRQLTLATSVYFISDDSLLRVDGDGTQETLLATGATAITEYVVGEAWIYAIADGRPVRIPRTGGVMESLILSPNEVPVSYRGLSVGDDGYVYMFELGHYATVVRVPTDRGGVQVFSATSDLAASAPVHFTATDGSCVFYTTNAAVFRVCGASTAIGSGPVKAGLAFDATSVYWATATEPPVIYAWCRNATGVAMTRTSPGVHAGPSGDAPSS